MLPYQNLMPALVSVTASQPIDYNGMKIVGRGSKPLSNHEFEEIKELAEGNKFIAPKKGHRLQYERGGSLYLYQKVLGFVDYTNQASQNSDQLRQRSCGSNGGCDQ